MKMSAEDAICKRYSVRDYSQRDVEDDKLHQILEAGRLAPTARNCQPQRIYLFRSEKALEEIRRHAPMTFNAPVIMLVCADETQAAVGFSDRCFGETDVTIVMDHMMLRATELGLGTCWIGHFDQETVRKGLGLPETMRPWHIMLLGYPADGCAPSSMHSKRKSLEETVTEW